MDFGICIAKIDEVGIIAHAENLGYSHAWVADSQMIWSDCYAVLALAAQQTRTIRLGTGVSVVGTRIAPVTAHSIATINRLAPGRTFLGIGTGNTAMRLMGQRPVRLAAYEEYLKIVRALLNGEQVDYTQGGITAPIQMLMLEQEFMAVQPPIPIYVSGFGPKAQRLAGAYGDGLVMSIPPEPGFMTRARNNVVAGAKACGRALPQNFHFSSLTTAVLLEPGENLTSERVIRECGPFVTSSLHYIYERVREGGEPPARVRNIWNTYTALMEQTPERQRHMRIHDGHCTYLHPDEAQFVTPEMIRATCLAGRPGEVIEQVRALAAAGLQHLILLPALDAFNSVLESFTRQVMEKL